MRNAARMTAGTAAPFRSSSTATNWDAPAKMTRLIPEISVSSRPDCRAVTPNVVPTTAVVRRIGQPSTSASRAAAFIRRPA